jgi:regulator of sigma E protease
MGSSLFNYFETLIALAVMFTMLVAAHELGHYLFARLFNMGVEEFAIGFGKRPILQWMRRTYTIPIRPGEIASIEHSGPSKFDLESAASRPPEDMVEIDTPSGKALRETTRFTVRAWPLGGFVRIKGMMPEEDGSETKIAGGFYSKPPWQRLIVLFAGPLFSVLAGILILAPIFMIEGSIPNLKPVLGPLLKGGAAMKAGLKEGDRIASIDGKPVATFYNVVQLVRDSQNKTLNFGVVRGNQTLYFPVKPDYDEKPTHVLDATLEPTKETRRQWKLNAQPTFDPAPPVKALLMACSFPVTAVAGLGDIVVHPSTFKDQVGGPLSITTATYDTVKMGFSSILRLAALLSISIGILNLLPVAPLDGGQIVLAIAEMCRKGRRLSIQFQSMVTMFGFAFMVVLIICVCCVDISRIIDNGKAPKESPPAKATK